MPTRARRRLREHTVGLLARKWTLKIAMALDEDTKRHSEIARCLPGITQKVLTETLREMERTGIVDLSDLRLHPWCIDAIKHRPQASYVGALRKFHPCSVRAQLSTFEQAFRPHCCQFHLFVTKYDRHIRMPVKCLGYLC